MRSAADYLALIPPEHAGKPKFMATVALVMQPFADAQTFLAGLSYAFDLDEAVGVQLDATGAWIGRSRQIPVPVQNPWFSFDTPGLGFDQGYWQGPYDGSALVDLDDPTYRRLLYAVRYANQADGTVADMQSALDIYFDPTGYPNTKVFVVDKTDLPNTDLYFAFDDSVRGFDHGYWFSSGDEVTSLEAMDLAVAVGISGQLPNPVDLEILWQLLIPFKPAGVRIDWGCTTVDGAPVFGFDIESPFIAGFDVGAWGNTPDWVAQNVATGALGLTFITTESGATLTTESGLAITA